MSHKMQIRKERV